MVVEPPNLGPDFRDIPLAAALAARSDLPAFLDRDTNVAALGERAFGAARGCDDFIYLTVSTGIGGAIVTGGELLHGPDGLAGELGHVPVELDGPRCGCGGIGHVEAYRRRRGPRTRGARGWSQRGRSRRSSRRAPRGSAPRRAVRRATSQRASSPATRPASSSWTAPGAPSPSACVGYVNAFNPHRIVIGGSIAEARASACSSQVRDAIAQRGLQGPRPARHASCPPALGGDVSLAGAQPLVMSPARTVASWCRSAANRHRQRWQRPTGPTGRRVPGGTRT